jgi:hypothetical protein
MIKERPLVTDLSGGELLRSLNIPVKMHLANLRYTFDGLWEVLITGHSSDGVGHWVTGSARHRNLDTAVASAIATYEKERNLSNEKIRKN